MTTTITPTIVIEGLHKSYGQVYALDELDLMTEEGSALPSSAPMAPAKRPPCAS